MLAGKHERRARKRHADEQKEQYYFAYTTKNAVVEVVSIFSTFTLCGLPDFQSLRFIR